MSGLAQFVAARGLGTLQEWCEEGYKAITRIDEDMSGEVRSVMHRRVRYKYCHARTYQNPVVLGLQFCNSVDLFLMHGNFHTQSRVVLRRVSIRVADHTTANEEQIKVDRGIIERSPEHLDAALTSIDCHGETGNWCAFVTCQVYLSVWLSGGANVVEDCSY